MAISSTQQTEILKIVAGLFNAAPGGVYLSELAKLVEGGMTTSQLADTLAASPIFTNGVMAGKVTIDAQVNVLMKNFGVTADSDPASAGSQAKTYFTQQIDDGVGFGKIVFDAVSFLSTTTDTKFAGAKTLLENKALVAAAYSAIKSSTDLSELQVVLSNVTGDSPYTDADVANILAGSTGGGAVVLTVNQDTPPASSQIEGPIFTSTSTGAQIQTLTSVDKLTGTAATTDTLNATVNGTEVTTKPTINGVENVNLTAIGASTFDAANSTGVNQIGSVDSTADLVVQNLAAGAKVYVKNTSVGTDTQVQFANSVVSGTSDAASIKVDNVGRGAVVGNTQILNVRGETTGSFETLNIESTGGASRFADIGSDSTVGVGVAPVAATSLVNTVNVTGSANLRVDNPLLNVTTVDANSFEGNLRVALDAAKNVTVTGGKGDDYFDFAGGLSNLDKVTGGDGRDTVAVTSNVGLGDGNQITGIETLRNDGAPAATAFDLSKVSSFDSVVHNSPNTATYNNLSKTGAADSAAGLTILGTGNVTVDVKGANSLGSNSDVLQVKVGDTKNLATFAAGTVTTSAIEKIIVDVKDAGGNTATAGAAPYLTADAALGTVEYKGGSAGVAFAAGTVGGSGVALTKVDGSAFVGDLTASGNAFSQVILGGSGNDTLATGGQAAFTLGTVADTMTGNGGRDVFSFDALTDGSLTGANLTAVDAPAAVTATNRGEITTITDLNLGGANAGTRVDTIDFTDLGGASSLGGVAAGGFAIVNGGAATALTGVDLGAALNTLVTTGVLGAAGAPAAGLFTWSGDTYLVATTDAGGVLDNFGAVAGEDIVIKVTGVTGTLDVSDFV